MMFVPDNHSGLKNAMIPRMIATAAPSENNIPKPPRGKAMLSMINAAPIIKSVTAVFFAGVSTFR